MTIASQLGRKRLRAAMPTSDDLFYRLPAYKLRRVAGSGRELLIAGENFERVCRWGRVARDSAT